MIGKKSLILYRGPSLLDGSPIVAVAVWSKRNKKTGGMLQTYILADNGRDPMQAITDGSDSAVCGSCPHRGDPATGRGRSCYVIVSQGPLTVYRALMRGLYPVSAGPHEVEEIGRGRMVRLGTYGDPAAVPAIVWRSLVAHAAGWTGYSHQWRAPVAADLRDLCMASADSEQEARDAVAAGWRYYRVRPIGSPADPLSEIDCPSSRGVQCADCGLCAGVSAGRAGARSVSIELHGGSAILKHGARLIPTIST